MAPSELAEIRALLIAQTQTVEIRRPANLLGVVGSLLRPRAEPPVRPITLHTPVAAPRKPVVWHGWPAAPEGAATCGAAQDEERSPLLLGDEIDPDMFAPLDLPPPPRAAFGVRSPRPYLPHDSVLLLNKLAPAEPRRLTLLTEAGEAVGEIYLKPEGRRGHAIYDLADPADEHQAPFFPGDLEEHEPGPPPLMAASHWADRGKVGAQTSRAPTCAPPPRPTARPGSTPGLGLDLLQALAVTLSREHETLSDLLTATAGWSDGSTHNLTRRGV
jgi:hypothetical protein